MLHPAPVLSVVCAVLNKMVQRHRTTQRRCTLSRSVIFDQCIHHERLTIEYFSIVDRFAADVRFPKVTVIFVVEKFFCEKAVTVLSRLKTWAFVVEPMQMRMRKCPDHACLRCELFFFWRGATFYCVVAQQKTAVTRIDCFEPVWKNF